jgi:hypothetical protein
MSNWARIIALFVSVSLFVFSFEAKAIVYGDQDDNPYGTQGEDHAASKCDDEIPSYQRAVNVCLNNATTLDEARDCWSAQP